MDRAERVRQVLSTKGLTLYRVSQLSAQMFGRSSRYYIPHNLYYDVGDPGLLPTIHQVLALSRITGYVLVDWLSVFGFDLDAIPRLQLAVSRHGTTLLNSTIYDGYAWIPWFSERRRSGLTPPIAPLVQLLGTGSPRRAKDLLGLSRRGFLYGKIGQRDVHALPHFMPGSIIRVDPRCTDDQPLEIRSSAENRFFLVEREAAFTCSQLVFVSKDRVVLRCSTCPLAQVELRLGHDARILGMVDAEIRPLNGLFRPLARAQAPAPPKPPARRSSNGQTDLKALLRNSRERVGLPFRDASSLSRWIARSLSDELYFSAASTLSDYETLSAAPRHIQKIITLCVLYGIEFFDFLRACGLLMDDAGHEPVPDQLLSREPPKRSHGSQIGVELETSGTQTGFLSALLREWEEVPLFLRGSLDELTGLKNFSLSDVFWVGGNPGPLHPWLRGASFVAINRRVKKPAGAGASPCNQPLYLILLRDGSYECGACTLDQGQLVLHSYPRSPLHTRRFKNGADAEVIGQVTAILRRFP